MKLSKSVFILTCIGISAAQIYAAIISTDFNQGDDGWNHGLGIWSVQTNGNGISANNPYLLIDPNAVAPKRGVVVWNENANWTGNYATKNVTGLNLQVRNASIDSPLYLRIAIGNTRSPQSGTWFVSDSLSLLSYDDGWSTVTFDINSNSMVKASSAMMNGSPGSGSFNDVFTDVAAIRIISQGSAFSAIAEDHFGDVYIDSVALIPEPHTVGFITLSSLILAMRRSAHRKKQVYPLTQTDSHLLGVEDRFTTKNSRF